MKKLILITVCLIVLSSCNSVKINSSNGNYPPTTKKP